MIEAFGVLALLIVGVGLVAVIFTVAEIFITNRALGKDEHDET